MQNDKLWHNNIPNVSPATHMIYAEISKQKEYHYLLTNTKVQLLLKGQKEKRTKSNPMDILRKYNYEVLGVKKVQ